jgi:hypothetical protein
MKCRTILQCLTRFPLCQSLKRQPRSCYIAKGFLWWSWMQMGSNCSNAKTVLATSLHAGDLTLPRLCGSPALPVLSNSDRLARIKRRRSTGDDSFWQGISERRKSVPNLLPSGMMSLSVSWLRTGSAGEPHNRGKSLDLSAMTRAMVAHLLSSVPSCGRR